MLAINPPTDYFFFILGAILYCLAILPTALSRAAMPQPLKAARLNLRRLYANSPISAVGCFVIGVVNGSFGTLGPVYGQQIGLPIGNVATLMAGSLLGGALIQFPLGRVSDRMDRRRVLLAVTAVAFVIGAAMAILQPRGPVVVTSVVIVFGAMIYSMYSLTVAHANDYATGDDFVEIAGGLLLLYGIGTMIGPVIAAQTMERLSAYGLFVFTATVHLMMAAYTYFRISRRAPLAPVGRPAFHGLILPKTVTPESATLDPRADGEEPEGDTPPPAT
jgi:MFS family permease